MFAVLGELKPALRAFMMFRTVLMYVCQFY